MIQTLLSLLGTLQVKTRQALLALPVIFAASDVVAQAEGTVVVAGPFTGTYAPLGDLMREAARELPDAQNTQFVDTVCDAETADNAVMEILALAPTTVLGIPCIDVFDILAPVLIEAGISITTVGLQTPDVTDDPDGLVRRVSPTVPQIHARLAAHLSDAWRDVPFAIVDDGTLSGRLLAEQVGGGLAESSLEPIFRDTYRPLLSNQVALVRRLSRAGVQHVILGGDSFDAAIIGADAKRLGLNLVIAGGPNLLGTPEDGQLPDGTLIATAPSFGDLMVLAVSTLNPDPQAHGVTFSADGEPIENLSILQVVRDGVPTTISPTSGNAE